MQIFPLTYLGVGPFPCGCLSCPCAVEQNNAELYNEDTEGACNLVWTSITWNSVSHDDLTDQCIYIWQVQNVGFGLLTSVVVYYDVAGQYWRRAVVTNTNGSGTRTWSRTGTEASPLPFTCNLPDQNISGYVVLYSDSPYTCSDVELTLF